MKTKILFTLVIALSFSVFAVNAQHGKRPDRQELRIKHGHKNGKLTKKEKRYFAHKNRELRKDLRKARMNDGRISRRERAKIMRDHRLTSRDIHWHKYNRHKRF